MRARILRFPPDSGLWALLAACVVALGGTGARPAAASPAVPAVRTHAGLYDGRHRDDPRFERAFGDLDGEVDRALRVIEDRLGLTPRGGATIHVFIHDADTSRFGHDRARCRTHVAGGKRFQHIDLYVPYFVSGDSDVRTVVTHELVHAVMRDCMARRQYERLPHWVREGLAVHVADEGRRHLRRTMVACESVGALMTGLVADRRSVQMYPYSWLAVEHLVEVGGPTALRRFAKGLVRGDDPLQLAARITQRTWPRFEQGVRAHARARIEAAAEGLEAIQRLKRRYRSRRYHDARALAAAFLRDHGDSAFAPTARYYAARAWFREGRYDRAEVGFRDCLDEDLGLSGWSDECQLFLGIALLEQDRNDEALAALRNFVDLQPHSDQRDLGRLALGRALRRLERDGEARRVWRTVTQDAQARPAHRAAAARELARLAE